MQLLGRFSFAEHVRMRTRWKHVCSSPRSHVRSIFLFALQTSLQLFARSHENLFASLFAPFSANVQENKFAVCNVNATRRKHVFQFATQHRSLRFLVRAAAKFATVCTPRLRENLFASLFALFSVNVQENKFIAARKQPSCNE